MSALTKAQAEQLKLLRAADGGTLPRNIRQDNAEFSFEILRELCEAGLITATYFHAIVPAEQCFVDPRITYSGRQRLAELEKLAVPDQAPDPASSAAKREIDRPSKPLVKLAWAVMATIVGAAALYLLTHHLGIPL